MKKVVIYFFVGLLVMFLFTYVGLFYDDAFKKIYPNRIWNENILNSFKYYIYWVLPYWWLMILIGSVMFASLFCCIHMIVKKITKKHVFILPILLIVFAFCNNNEKQKMER